MKNFLSKFDLEIIKVPGDGHCFFHSVLQASYLKYKNSDYDNKVKIVQLFRSRIAKKLPEYYENLSRGKLKELSKDFPEFELNNMIKELDSNNYIKYGYFEYISNILEKDIFILNTKTNSIYITDEYELSIKGRDSIIIAYNGIDHYDLIGLNHDNKIKTYFSKNHELILEIKKEINLK